MKKVERGLYAKACAYYLLDVVKQQHILNMIYRTKHNCSWETSASIGQHIW